MPEPLIVHIIGTTALLSAVFLIVASFTMIQQINYVQTLNVMLAEAAESCAREIVELVSIHTLGGEEVTYMTLNLPSSLGGQPYELILENAGENTIVVRAQLQIHKQVRIVVTPNFGQAPVYAVTNETKFGALALSPIMRLPTPLGWKAALVTVRGKDAVLLGFTTQPPDVVHPVTTPNFQLINWTLHVEGLAGSKQSFSFAIWNRGGKGIAIVHVYDSANRLVYDTSVTIESNSVERREVILQLPDQKGMHEWHIRVWHENTLMDEKRFTVISRMPNITISNYDQTLSGLPGSTVKLTLTLTNAGDYMGTAICRINSIQLPQSYPILPGQSVTLEQSVTLPDEIGRFIWVLEVVTNETNNIEYKTIIVRVTSPDAPRFSETNRTIEGLVGWRCNLFVCVTNPSTSDAVVELLINGSSLGSLSVPATGTKCKVYDRALPSIKGFYVWNLSLVKSGLLLDERFIRLIVKNISEGITRTAILYDTFSSPGNWEAKGGEWRIFGGELIGTDKDKSGFCAGSKGPSDCATVYYWKTELPSFGSLSALVQVHLNEGDVGVSRGFALLDSRLERLYGVLLYRGSGKSSDLRIVKFENGWSVEDTTPSMSLRTGTYVVFFQLSIRDLVTFTYQAYDLQGNPIRDRRDKSISVSWIGWPKYFGLLVDEKTGTFDNVVLATGDSRYITVKGLPSRWKLEVYSGSEYITGAESDGFNDLLLFVVRRPIIENARVVVRDPRGEFFREYQMGILVGGDVLIFSP